jgi:hypothetical protein
MIILIVDMFIVIVVIIFMTQSVLYWLLRGYECDGGDNHVENYYGM